MPEFDKPHIDISARVRTQPYQAPRQNVGGGGATRIREEHGALLATQLETAFFEADEHRPTDGRLESAEGIFIEVDLKKGSNPEKSLQRKSDNIQHGATKRQENGDLRVALFVPNEARPILSRIIEDYRSGELSAKDKPPHQDKVEPIDAIRRARLETFWTDDASALPANPHDTIWWEAWCFKGMEGKVNEAAIALNALVAEEHYWLKFPEAVVIPIRTSKVTIELLLFATAGIAELRRASASPTFFLGLDAEDQLGWAENLAERIQWPANDVPAVCLLDTGVNRGHMLIEPALAPNDTMSVNAAWNTNDHEGHGTGMAGLALFSDLTPVLEGGEILHLTHRLESVKILPPNGFPANEPESYGSITQSAVSLAEVNNPERSRSFCLAVTNAEVSGGRATTWSASIDQAAIGKMQGDEENAPKRLFLVSAGNAPAEIDATLILDADSYPIEDPAQAWNAITVGGYTNKTDIDDHGYEAWTALKEAGEADWSGAPRPLARDNSCPDHTRRRVDP